MKKNEVFSKRLIFPLFGGKKDVVFQASFYIDHYNAGIFDMTPANIFKPGNMKTCITQIKKKQPNAIVLLRHGPAGQNKLTKNIDILPSNRSLGLNATYSDVYKSALVISKELKSLGVDIIISDILGINISGENPVLGINSFCDEPAVVSKLSTAYKNGIIQGGTRLVCTGFPGKGDLEVYYKDKITTYKRDLDSMFLDELIPYVNMIREGIDMLELSDLYYFRESMTVHEPATISHEIVDYLRNPLDFKGIILSFPIYRENFNAYHGLTLIRRCIGAGCDLVYLSGELKSNIEILDEMVVELSTGKFPLFKRDVPGLKVKGGQSEESLYYLKKENLKIIGNIDDNISSSFDSKGFSFINESQAPIIVYPEKKSDSIGSGESFFKSIKYYKRKAIPVMYGKYNTDQQINDILTAVNGREVLIISTGVYSDKHLADLFIKIKKSASKCAIIGIGIEYEQEMFLDIPYFCIGTDVERTFKRVIKELF